MPVQHPNIFPCGDSALTVSLGDGINSEIHQEVMTLFKYIQSNPTTGLRDVVPAYNTLTLIYDVATLNKVNPNASAYGQMRGYMEKALKNSKNANLATRSIDIPVCYDVSVAPDLLALAALHSLTIDEVVKLHASKTYRVYMTGFLPGFAYMASVDKQIRTARKEKPRTVVPAGSVGVAGEQTGIYPFDSPGGWQLIGQTPLKMFDAAKREPCLLQPGDEVNFYPVTIDEFTKMKAK